MGVLKNDVGRPSNKTIKIRFILKAVLLIVVAGGLFIGGYLLNNELNDKKNDVGKSETSKKTNLTEEEAKTIFNNVFGGYNALLSDLRFEDINSDRFKTYLTLNTHLLRNEKVLKNEALCDKSMLVGDYSLCEGKFANYDDINKAYKKMFGNDNNASKLNILEDLSGLINYEYIYEEDKYLLVVNLGGDGGRSSLEGIKEAYKLDNKVYITYLLAECDPLSLETETICNGKEEFKMPLQDALDNKYEAYSDKMEELTFIFFKEDGVYKFEKVIKK